MRKEGRNWGLRRFQQFRSYRDEIETRNREEIPLSLRLVPRGLVVAEGPKTALQNIAHLYRDRANPLGDPAKLPVSHYITCQIRIHISSRMPLYTELCGYEIDRMHNITLAFRTCIFKNTVVY